MTWDGLDAWRRETEQALRLDMRDRLHDVGVKAWPNFVALARASIDPHLSLLQPIATEIVAVEALFQFIAACRK